MSFDEIKVGDQQSYERTVSEEDVKKFLAITGDINRLHSDSHFAASTRFKGLVVPGMLTASYALTAITLYYERIVLMDFQAKFIKPVRMGDTVVAKISVTEKKPDKNHLRFRIECSVDRQVVCEGVVLSKAIR